MKPWGDGENVLLPLVSNALLAMVGGNGKNQKKIKLSAKSKKVFALSFFGAIFK